MPSSHRPLILGYHAVSSTWRSQLAVPESRLRAQVRYLRRRGFVGLTLSEAERGRTEDSLPPKCVVLTFDDGYASTMRAAEILDEVGFPGTVFLVTSVVETGGRFSWPGIEHWLASEDAEELRSLVWSDAEALVARGWEIGSHTVSHPLLTSADDTRLRQELVESRAEIERRLGSCTAIAYPYGLADGRVARAARNAGYLVGCTLTWAQAVDEPYRRPRTGMGSTIGTLRAALRFSQLGQAARRTRAARLGRALRGRRDWLPDAGGASSSARPGDGE
jgi:peptidoglycan/xylan/chitin deacetylase (PgdA/CDA1 family)